MQYAKKRPKYAIATPGNSAPGDCSPNGAGTQFMRQHDANPHVRQFLNVAQRLIFFDSRECSLPICAKEGLWQSLL